MATIDIIYAPTPPSNPNIKSTTFSSTGNHTLMTQATQPTSMNVVGLNIERSERLRRDHIYYSLSDKF